MNSKESVDQYIVRLNAHRNEYQQRHNEDIDEDQLKATLMFCEEYCRETFYSDQSEIDDLILLA